MTQSTSSTGPAAPIERPTGAAPPSARPRASPAPGQGAAVVPGGPSPGGPTGSWGLPLAVLIVGMFMSILDTSIVNVAIPTIQREFGTTTEDIQWISTAYTLCLGIVVPATAWLGDRYGLRQLYLVALVAFAAMSALCGLAWSLPAMIFFRVLQAVPGGILPVVCLSMVYRMVPRQKIGFAMGLYGLGIVVAPALGPSLGGYLVEYVSWRLIFDINVPIGLLGALAAFAVLPRLPRPPRRPFDLPGFVAVGTGLFALLLAVEEGQNWGWTGYRVLILVVGGLLSLALFVVIELEVAVPLLDVRILRHWPFVNSLLLVVVLMVCLFATMFYIPLFLQQGQQMQAFDAGLLLLPQATVLVALNPVSGRIYDRFGPRWPAAIGLAISGVGTYLLTGINGDMTRDELVWWLCVRALGQGLAMTPVMTGGLSSLPGPLINQGSAINNLVQRVSSAFGLAVLTALSTRLETQLIADQSALLPASAAVSNPTLAQLSGQGTKGLYPIYQRMELDGMARAYSNMFLGLTVLAGIGALLALLLRSGPAPARGGPPAAGPGAPAQRPAVDPSQRPPG